MTFSVSLEFFPPKSELGQKQLQRTVDALSVYQPDFASVTYGAGGTTQIGSVNIIADLSKRLPCPVHGHLTMVNSSAERVWHNLNAFKSVGAGGYVILRGDAEGSGAQSYAFQTMGQFVTAAKHQTGQPVYVAAYPTKHPKAASMHADIQVLKAKLDTGADGAITQFFFEAHEFLRFRDLCAKARIDKPIIPGILPFRRAAS
ncbi:MAG: methylenetetrahydrofolate reductase, partial [Pseudomonadota bacterium]